MKLKDTVVMMNSPNYQDRFRAEYWQNEIRLEKLLNLIDKYRRNALDFEPNCDLTILQAQAKYMTAYKNVLIERADMEDIKLNVK